MSTDLKQVNKLKKNSRRIENGNDQKFVERLIKISRVSSFVVTMGVSCPCFSKERAMDLIDSSDIVRNCL